LQNIDLISYHIVNWLVARLLSEMLKWLKNNLSKKKLPKKESRLEQMKKNPYRRVDSDNMTEIEKMDQGFNGKTFSINGMDIDF
jgi:hypothetical protein